MGKIAFYRQTQSNGCGPASLIMLLHYYGISVFESEINKRFPLLKDGWNIPQLIKAASHYGLRLTPKLEIENNDIENAILPIIIATNNHYIVLYKIKNAIYYVADPAFGKIRMSKEEFYARYNVETIILLFPSITVLNVKAQKTSSLSRLSIIVRYLSQYKGLLLKASGVITFVCISQVIIPFLTRSIIDSGIQSSSWDYIKILMVSYIILIISNLLGTFVHTFIVSNITYRIKTNMLEDYFHKTLSIKYSFFLGIRVGDLLQRITDTERIQAFLSGPLLQSIVSVFFCLGFVCVLAYFSIKLFIIYIIFAVSYILWMALFLSQRKKLDFNFWNLKSENNKLLIQSYDNIIDIKCYKLFNKFYKRWKNNVQLLFKQNLSYFYFTQIQEMGSNFILNTKDIIITFFSCKLVIDGKITIGTLFAMQYILGSLNSPLIKIADFINQCQLLLISLGRISSHNSLPDDKSDELIPFIPRSKNLTLRNVTFIYPDNTIGLNRINCMFPQGKKYGIMGKSGSGKSTLLKVISQLLQPITGDIWLGTTNLKSINFEDYNEIISANLQESQLFEGSILENIVGEMSNYDENRLIKSVEVACIRTEIELLPDAYNTLIEGDYRHLSKGQAQRLLIARCIYKEASIYLFDEIANCLNVNMEQKVIGKIDQLLTDKTRIYVSHRPEGLEDSDFIVVMENGNIIDIDKYDQLIKRNRIK